MSAAACDGLFFDFAKRRRCRVDERIKRTKGRVLLAGEAAQVAYTFRFDPGIHAYPLRTLSRADAERRLKSSLNLQSRVPGREPPRAVVLLDNGLEVWRWTQVDRTSDL